MFTIIRSKPVFVDEAIFPYRGVLYCHMFCEDLDRLHGFARRIGLQLTWFQQPPKASWCHYDLAPTKRAKAVNFGAIEVDRWEASLFSRRIRGTLTPEWEQTVATCRASK